MNARLLSARLLSVRLYRSVAPLLVLALAGGTLSGCGKKPLVLSPPASGAPAPTNPAEAGVGAGAGAEAARTLYPHIYPNPKFDPGSARTTPATEGAGSEAPASPAPYPPFADPGTMSGSNSTLSVPGNSTLSVPGRAP